MKFNSWDFNGQRLGRQKRQIGLWPLTLNSYGPFGKSMGWMKRNTEMIMCEPINYLNCFNHRFIPHAVLDCLFLSKNLIIFGIEIFFKTEDTTILLHVKGLPI